MIMSQSHCTSVGGACKAEWTTEVCHTAPAMQLQQASVRTALLAAQPAATRQRAHACCRGPCGGELGSSPLVPGSRSCQAPWLVAAPAEPGLLELLSGWSWVTLAMLPCRAAGPAEWRSFSTTWQGLPS